MYSQAAAGAVDTGPDEVPSRMKGAWHAVVRTHPATGHYPHADSSWPYTQEIPRQQFEGIDPAVARAVTLGNACELFQHPLPSRE
ncbi:hypothetical protein [Streptomyces sp. JNUCC 63]